MSAKALFTPGSGDYHTPANDRIATLPKNTRVAAQLVWNAVMSLLPMDKTELSITDHMLKQSAWLKGYSYRFVQKGLQALSPNVFNKNTHKWSGGLGLIDRKRRRGLRTIIVIARLRGSDREAARSKIGNRRERVFDSPRLTSSPVVTRVPIAQDPAEPESLSPEQEEERRRMLDGWRVRTKVESSLVLDQADTDRRKAIALAQLAAIRDGPPPDTGSPEAPSGP